MTELDDTQTITALKSIFVQHYQDFGITDEQASALAFKFHEDVCDFECDIETPHLGQAARHNITKI